MMKITLYKSALCPRCHMAGKYLMEELQDFPEVQLEQVDILTAPFTAIQAGVRMIPAIMINGHKLSSVYLGRKEIRSFLREHLS